MLLSWRCKYHPHTYLEQFIGLKARRYSAEGLRQLVQDLQAYYERARLRLYTIRDQEYPVLPMEYWCFCYNQAFAVDCQRSMLHPKKSDYLTRVIDLAAEAEERIPPPSLCEDSRRPKFLSCPALQAGSLTLSNQGCRGHRTSQLTSAHQLAFNPYLWILRQEGTPYTVCNISRLFVLPANVLKTLVRSAYSEDSPSVTALRRQNAKNEIIHPEGFTPEGGSAQMPDDSEAQYTQTRRDMMCRGSHYCPEFTLADSEIYHELGRKREDGRRDGGSWSLTEKSAHQAIATKRAIHFEGDLPCWVESND
ncbi:hypothetical protein Esti_006880 [Eimeria stiedai]